MQTPSNLVWLDLEMTGLEPETDQIIEVAVLVTDFALNILAEGPCVAIHQGEEVLDAMDEWCTRTHSASGLIERVRTSQLNIAEVDQQVAEFVNEWVPAGKSPAVRQLDLSRSALCPPLHASPREPAALPKH